VSGKEKVAKETANANSGIEKLQMETVEQQGITFSVIHRGTMPTRKTARIQQPSDGG